MLNSLKILFFICCLCGVAACAGKHQDSASIGNNSTQSQPQHLVFRHKVSLEFPNRTTLLVFDGVLQLNGEQQPLLRAVGLGAMGITLFDLTIDKSGVSVAAINPAIARLPHFRQQIALCLASFYNKLFGVSMFEFDKSTKDSLEMELSGERPWPQLAVFRHAAPEYIVKLRLAGVQNTDVERMR